MTVTLNPLYRFDTFVVGAANRLAVTAAKAVAERSDVTAVPAMGVIAEAMAALVLADAMLEKFGGDSVPETRRNLEAYRANIHEHMR